MARPGRFELPTCGFEVRCSIQLSYRRAHDRYSKKSLSLLRWGGGKPADARVSVARRFFDNDPQRFRGGIKKSNVPSPCRIISRSYTSNPERTNRVRNKALKIRLLVNAFALGEGIRHPNINRECVVLFAFVEEDTVYDNRDEIVSAQEIEFEG